MSLRGRLRVLGLAVILSLTAFVPMGANGAISVYATDTTDLIVDINLQIESQ